MIVYIPTPITSVEQAEALPAGTLAWHSEGTGVDHAHKVAPLPGHHEGGWITLAGYAVNFQIIGWSALVSVEAEEETVACGNDWSIPTHEGLMPNGDAVPNGWTIHTRYVTPWEPDQVKEES